MGDALDGKGFHWVGERVKSIFAHSDVVSPSDGGPARFNGKPLATSLPTKKWVSNPVTYYSWFSDPYCVDSKTCVCCSLCCNETNITSNLSNMKSHIIAMHPEHTAYEHLDLTFKTNINNRWRSISEGPRIRAGAGAGAGAGAVAGARQSIMQQLASQNLPRIGDPERVRRQTIIVDALILGGFGLGPKENQGMKMILDNFVFSPGTELKGFSRRTITRLVEDKHKKMQADTKKAIQDKLSCGRPASTPALILADKLAEIERFDNGSSEISSRRLVAGMHDAWQSRQATGFLGVIIALMDISNLRRWVITVIVLACTLFESPHTADNCRKKNFEVFAKYGLGPEDFIAEVQDTTASSINTFKNDINIGVLGCFAHTGSLTVKHTFELSPILDTAFNEAKKLALKIGGSGKRLQALRLSQSSLGKKYLKPKLPPVTRWNYVTDTWDRVDVILPAIKIIPPAELGIRDRASQQEHATLLDKVEDDILIYRKIKPVLDVMAQWTQVLGSKTSIVVSLVLPAISAFERALETLKSDVDGYPAKIATARSEFQSASEEEKLDCQRLLDQLIAQEEALQEFSNNYEIQLDKYFGEDYKSNWLFRVSILLDPSVCKFFFRRRQQWAAAKEALLDHLITEEEKITPDRPRETHEQAGRGLSLDDMLVNENENEINVQPLLSPFNAEYNSYIKKIAAMTDEELLTMDTLSFWPSVSMTLPILARAARQVLSVQVVSNSVEQLFSSGGNLDTPKRNRLTPGHFEDLLVTQKWMQEKVNLADSRSEKSRLRLIKLRQFILVYGQLTIVDDSEEDLEEDLDIDDADEILPDDEPLEEAIIVDMIEQRAAEIAEVQAEENGTRPQRQRRENQMVGMDQFEARLRNRWL